MTLSRLFLWMLAFLCVVAPLQAVAAEIQSLSVEQAVELALQRNPTLRAQSLSIVSGKANEVTAGLRANPQ